MYVVTERRNGVDGLDNVACEIARMRGRKAHPPYAGDLPDCGQQLREAPLPFRIAIRIDILAEQLNLGVSGVGHALRLGQHRRRCPAALLAARVRNHAVGAELVAALDDRDVSPVGIRARSKLRLEGLFGLAVVEPGNALRSLLQLYQHLRKSVIRSRAGDDGDVRRTLEDPLALLLRHASEHSKALSLLVQRLVVVEPVEDLLLRLIAY